MHAPAIHIAWNRMNLLYCPTEREMIPCCLSQWCERHCNGDTLSRFTERCQIHRVESRRSRRYRLKKCGQYSFLRFKWPKFKKEKVHGWDCQQEGRRKKDDFVLHPVLVKMPAIAPNIVPGNVSVMASIVFWLDVPSVSQQIKYYQKQMHLPWQKWLPPESGRQFH